MGMAPVQVGGSGSGRAVNERRMVMGAWIAIAALLLGGGVGWATTGDSSKSTAAVSAAGKSTSTTAALAPVAGAGAINAAPAAGPAPASGPATTTKASAKPSGGSSAPTTTPTTAAANLGPAQDPGPPVPPKPGTYKQKLTTTTNSSTTTSEVTVKIENESQAGGVTNQRVTTSTDKGSSASELSWKADSILLLSNTFGSGAQAATCTWTPPIQAYALPLKVGAKWNSDSQCTVSVQGQTENVHETATSTVVRLERISEAGKVLDTWVVSRTIHIEGKGVYAFTTDTTQSEWFAPKFGQIAKSAGETKSTFTFNGQTNSTDSKATTDAETLDPS